MGTSNIVLDNFYYKDGKLHFLKEDEIEKVRKTIIINGATHHLILML